MSDSQDTPPPDGQKPGKINLPEENEGEFAVTAIKQTIRFAALANAGGALATMTAIGATAKDGVILSVLAWPLGLFAAGIVCALLTTAGMIFIAGDISNPTPGKWAGIWAFVVPALDWIGDVTGIAMIVFFILGCISGVSIIAEAP